MCPRKIGTGTNFVPRCPMFRTKRVYDPPRKSDGCRVLVDRLWPRGLSKAAADVQMWLREIAPSDALRKWFAHDPARWEAFRRKYRAELKANPEPVRILKRLERERGVVTLVFAASDTAHSNAVALVEVLKHRG